MKMLPNFLIVGPPKCGTTSLQIYLSQHKEIFIPNPGKEIHFFDENYEKGIKWYEKFFESVKKEEAIGEKSPSYFFHPEAPKRIKKHIPNAKIIFIFRNPVDRAYSHYWHNVRAAGENMSFEGAIKREINGETKNNASKYLEIGKYVVHLRRWEKYFPKSQMFFMVMEDLNIENIKKLLKFLGVDEDLYIKEFKKYNIGGAPRSKILSKVSQHPVIKKIPYLSDFINRVINMRRGKYPPMKVATRRYLLNYFEPYNRELEKFTGLNLERWEK